MVPLYPSAPPLDKADILIVIEVIMGYELAVEVVMV